MLDRTIIPAASPLHKVAYPAISPFRLSNGLPVYSCLYGGQEVVDLSIIFPAGRCFEHQTGVASFASKLMQEGTMERSGLEFARQLDFFGASIQVECSFETATVNLTCLTKHLASTLPLLQEMLIQPLFAASELENHRQRTIHYLEVEDQKTGFTARKHFNRLLFGANQLYGKHSEKEDIAAIQLDDVQAFHKRYFNLANAEFIVTGRFDQDGVVKLLDQHFGQYPTADPALKVTEAEIQGLAMDTELNKSLHYFEKPDSMQATIRVGHRSFPRNHEDYYPMQLVNTILGGYFGSRLMRNIREEKGYTYGIGSGMVSLKYAGLFVVQTDVGNQYIRPTLDEIDKEIEIFLRDGVQEDELQLVKNYTLGKTASGRETPAQITGGIHSMLLYGLPFSTLDEKFDQIQAVTTADVIRLANTHLHPGKMIQVVSGKMQD